MENKTWKIDTGSRTIELELTTLSSAHHVELNPSDAGFQDRYIVQDIIKEMAKNRPIDSKGRKTHKGLQKNLSLRKLFTDICILTNLFGISAGAQRSGQALERSAAFAEEDDGEVQLFLPSDPLLQ